MNYYPFHIGDYLSATRHLSWEEDAAYRRLLDTYYTTEKPLPAELRAVCRLVLATTDSQREAVETVLGEFFELTPDGWINGRADAEIQAMRDKQVENEVRDSHERDRMRRHRERRAEMFAALRTVGIIPPWDVSTKELQRLHDDHCNAPETKPETHLQREQAVSSNATATAIPIPTPTPTPTPNIPKEDTHTYSPPQGRVSDFEKPKPTKAAECAMAMKRGGIASVSPQHPELVAMANAGIEPEQFEQAAQAAAAKRKGFAYALGILRGQLREANAITTEGLSMPEKPWDESRSSIEAEGERLGLGRWDEVRWSVGQGPSFLEYTKRVSELRKQAGAA